MSWAKLNRANPSSRKRTLPPDMAGRKPLSPRYGINKGLLDAALRVWEIKSGYEPDPSPWAKSGSARA